MSWRSGSTFLAMNCVHGLPALPPPPSVRRTRGRSSSRLLSDAPGMGPPGVMANFGQSILGQFVVCVLCFCAVFVLCVFCVLCVVCVVCVVCVFVFRGCCGGVQDFCGCVQDLGAPSDPPPPPTDPLPPDRPKISLFFTLSRHHFH